MVPHGSAYRTVHPGLWAVSFRRREDFGTGLKDGLDKACRPLWGSTGEGRQLWRRQLVGCDRGCCSGHACPRGRVGSRREAVTRLILLEEAYERGLAGRQALHGDGEPKDCPMSTSRSLAERTGRLPTRRISG